VWVGVEQIGSRDGRVALFLAESLHMLLPPYELRSEPPSLSERAAKILEFLSRSGASFFAAIHNGIGAGFPGETRDALWELVWSGQITNDTFHPLRDLLRPNDKNDKSRDRHAAFPGTPPGSPDFVRRMRSRTSTAAQGRWSLIRQHADTPITPTEWSANIARQLLVRYGIVLRETAIAENIPRGYPTIYPALKTMEDSGWVRRGMFVAGLGAAQFAMPAAVDMLRSLRSEPETPEVLFLAATDPANLYGTVLPWPRRESDPEATDHDAALSSQVDDSREQKIATSNIETLAATPSARSMSRTSGAGVILINGNLVAFLRRRSQEIQVFLPEGEPLRSRFARELAKKLAELAIRRQGRKSGLLVGTVNGEPAREHFLARFIEESGFVNTAVGFQMRRMAPAALSVANSAEVGPQNDDDDESEPTDTESRDQKSSGTA
jgi:ATP-dependent Lhr-like helicase